MTGRKKLVSNRAAEGHPHPLFRLFLSFQTNITILTTNMLWPSSIWRQDLNPQPSVHESPPVTTWPGLPPKHCVWSKQKIKKGCDFSSLFYLGNLWSGGNSSCTGLRSMTPAVGGRTCTLVGNRTTTCRTSRGLNALTNTWKWVIHGLSIEMVSVDL